MSPEAGGSTRSLAAGLRRRLVGGAATAFALKLLGTGLAFALQVRVARALETQERFGIYATAIAWAGVLVLLGKSGMDSAALRFLPEYRGQARPAERLGFVATSRRRVLQRSVALALAGALLLELLPLDLAPELRGTLRVALATVPVLALLQLTAGFLQADRRMLASQGPLLCLLPGLALLGVLVLFEAVGTPPSPAAALAVYGAAAGLSLAVSHALFRDPRAGRESACLEQRSTWNSVGSALVLTSGFGLLLAQADILMLGALADPAAAGEYAAVSRLARFLSFPLLAANAIVAPLISELWHSGRRAELQRLLEHAVQGVLLVSSPLLLLLALRGEVVLGLFGEEYVEGKGALLVLLVGHTFNVLVGSVGYLLNLTGGHRTAARILGTSAAVNVLLNALLVPSHGTLGAAAATATTTVLWNASMYVAVRRRTGLRPSLF